MTSISKGSVTQSYSSYAQTRSEDRVIPFSVQHCASADRWIGRDDSRLVAIEQIIIVGVFHAVPSHATIKAHVLNCINLTRTYSSQSN